MREFPQFTDAKLKAETLQSQGIVPTTLGYRRYAQITEERWRTQDLPRGTPSSPTTLTLGWYPDYPDRIPRYYVPTAALPYATATGALSPVFPIPETSWRAQYPDRIHRAVVRATDQAFFFTGSTQSSLPVPALSWGPLYPDKIWRITLSIAVIPSLSEEPFPRPPATLLSAWAFYPDRIHRFAVHASRVPPFVLGPLVPIPNPPATYKVEDRVLLGQNQSLETPAYPSIGGSSTWS